jgi:hypothetical protein
MNFGANMPQNSTLSPSRPLVMKLRTIRDLTEAQCRLVEIMAKCQFGRVENLTVHSGQPVLAEGVRVVRVARLGAKNGGLPGSAEDYELKQAVRDLFDELERLKDCLILRLEFRHGLPCLLETSANTGVESVHLLLFVFFNYLGELRVKTVQFDFDAVSFFTLSVVVDGVQHNGFIRAYLHFQLANSNGNRHSRLDATLPVTFTQIQYSQNVALNFKGLSWPHVSVNTLVWRCGGCVAARGNRQKTLVHAPALSALLEH